MYFLTIKTKWFKPRSIHFHIVPIIVKHSLHTKIVVWVVASAVATVESAKNDNCEFLN